MAGQITRVCNKMPINVGDFVASTTSKWYILMKNIPAAQFRDFCLSLRVHSATPISSTSTLTFGVFNAPRPRKSRTLSSGAPFPVPAY